MSFDQPIDKSVTVRQKIIVVKHFRSEFHLRVIGRLSKLYVSEAMLNRISRNIREHVVIDVYLMRDLTDLTYLDIAKIMGKDHSTIIHSNNLIEEKIVENREVFEEIEAIKEIIK